MRVKNKYNINLLARCSFSPRCCGSGRGDDGLRGRRLGDIYFDICV